MRAHGVAAALTAATARGFRAAFNAPAPVFRGCHYRSARTPVCGRLPVATYRLGLRLPPYCGSGTVLLRGYLLYVVPRTVLHPFTGHPFTASCQHTARRLNVAAYTTFVSAQLGFADTFFWVRTPAGHTVQGVLGWTFCYSPV